MKPRNVIGSWIVPGGDEMRRQTARRTTMESKFMAIILFRKAGNTILKYWNKMFMLMVKNMLTF